MLQVQLTEPHAFGKFGYAGLATQSTQNVSDPYDHVPFGYVVLAVPHVGAFGAGSLSALHKGLSFAHEPDHEQVHVTVSQGAGNSFVSGFHEAHCVSGSYVSGSSQEYVCQFAVPHSPSIGLSQLAGIVAVTVLYIHDPRVVP